MNLRARLELDKKIADLLVSDYRLQVLNFRPFNFGIENSSGLVLTDKGGFVLRVYRPLKPNYWFEDELTFMSALRRSGIPVPQVFANQSGKFLGQANVKGQVWKYILMEYINGRSLRHQDHHLIQSVATHQALMHIASQSLSKTRRYSSNSLKSFFHYFVNENKIAKQKLSVLKYWGKIGPVALGLAGEFKEQIPKLMKLPAGAAHLDYDSDNILVSPTKLKGVIDFDDSVKMPYVMDLATSLWWWAFMNRKGNYRKLINDYLRNYQKVRKLTKLEISSLAFFARLRNLTAGVILGINRLGIINRKESEEVIEFDSVLRSEELFKI